MLDLAQEDLLGRFWEAIKRGPETKWLAVFLIVLSIFVHFSWLDYPWEVVFDEVHFGKFVTAYCCTQERFFDIHPPHAKLIIAGAGHLLGYQGEGPEFEHIGENYRKENPASLRFVPALAGSLLPLVFFVLLRQLGVGPAAAFLGGLVVIFDNSLVVQNRIISLDGILLLSIFGSLSAYLAAEKLFLKSLKWDKKSLAYFVLAGGLAGLAAGSKFTGLVALLLLGVLFFWRVWRSGSWVCAKRWAEAGLLVLLMSFLVYVLGWALHFLILSNPGPGDAWGVPEWKEPIVKSFVRETINVHKTMLSANYNLAASHPDSSKWWTWPFMKVSIFYWSFNSEEVTDKAGAIYFIGNPVVWWGAGLVLFLIFLNIVLAARVFLADISYLLGTKGWLVLGGYFLSFLPLVEVPRALFLYHYLTPLLFSVLAVVLWLEKTKVILRRSVKEQPPRYWIIVGLIIIGFVVMSPLTYGFVIDQDVHSKLFWLNSWR